MTHFCVRLLRRAFNVKLPLEHAACFIKDYALHGLADFIMRLRQTHMARHIRMAVPIEKVSPIQSRVALFPFNLKPRFKPRERPAKTEDELIKGRAALLYDTGR